MTKPNSTTKPPRARPGEAIQFVRDAAASDTDECVLWPEHWATKRGYGKVWHQGETVIAHRLTLSLATGVPMDDPRHAAHGECHNTLCCNPKHLSWKTSKENNADKLRDGTDNRGEKHHGAKLTEPEVLAIYRSSESRSVLAKKHGATQAQISRIKTGKRWGWLTGATAKTSAQISG